MWSKQIRAEQKMKKIEDEFDGGLSTGYATPNIVVTENAADGTEGEANVSTTMMRPLLGTSGAPGVSPGMVATTTTEDAKKL